MTNMPLLYESAMTTLNLATDEIRRALQLQQYHKVITETSTMVNDLLNLATEIVELRALASEKTNNIAVEHENASLLMQLNPNSPNGYLRAAKLYSIQGKQSKAIQALFAGIAWCPDQSQRAFLRQQIDKTKCHLERRIDFITRAPYDILCNILSHFTITTALTSIKVSQQWRDKVLHCPVPWRTIELPAAESTSSSRLLDRLLPIVSIYTKKLCLFKGPGAISHARLSVLPTFSRLQSLYISAETRNFRIDIASYLYTALPHISQTLQELTLYSVDISLGRILSICPNLQTICCKSRSVTGVSDEFPVPCSTSLTNVRLCSQEDIITLTDFGPILERSPHLQILKIHPFQGDILPIVGKHCPKLKVLRTTSANLDTDGEVQCDDIVTRAMSDGSPNGLQFLMISDVHSIQPLRSQLENGCNTIEYMYFEPIDGGTDAHLDWSPLSTTVMPNLKYLFIELSRCPSGFLSHLASMITCYPSLESLRLEGWHGHPLRVNDAPSPAIHSIFDAVASLAGLTCLHLDSFDIRPQSFNRLLERYSMRDGNHASLRELKLYNCCGVNTDTLGRVSRITSLVNLTLFFPANHGITAADMTEFIQRLSRLPELSILKFENTELTMEAARYITSCKTLSKMEAYDVRISEDTFNLLMDAMGRSACCIYNITA